MNRLHEGNYLIHEAMFSVCRGQKLHTVDSEIACFCAKIPLSVVTNFMLLETENTTTGKKCNSH